MVSTGLLVARACEGLTSGGKMASTKPVEELLATSSSSKARLLHYVSHQPLMPDIIQDRFNMLSKIVVWGIVCARGGFILDRAPC